MKSDEVIVDCTDDFAVDDAPKPDASAADAQMLDPHRLAQRQKQIDFGKNTLGYQRYTQDVPKSQRRKGHPRTPDVHQSCSKRAFDGQVRKWRRMLHAWDPEGEEQGGPSAAPQGSPTAPTTEAAEELSQPKNGSAQRPAGGLPLKMTPAVVRPTGKRSYMHTVLASVEALQMPRREAAPEAALAALISPPPCPPSSKQARKEGAAGEGEHVVQMRWAALAAAAPPSAESEDWAGTPQVCYSDDEEEGVQCMQVEITA